jgi:multicomponent Na+:H+ antiporter subunit F
LNIQDAYAALYTGALFIISLLLVLTFFRALKGPRIADRILSLNMIGTQVITMICLLALLLHEGYLTDIALIYAMISFLSVIVLCKVYLGVYLERKSRKAEKHE